MAQRAAKGKRKSPQVARFLLDLDRQCDALSLDLEAHSYRPSLGRAFWICDPKPRCIYALPFRDRVVQHMLIDATLETAAAPASTQDPHSGNDRAAAVPGICAPAPSGCGFGATAERKPSPHASAGQGAAGAVFSRGAGG